MASEAQLRWWTALARSEMLPSCEWFLQRSIPTSGWTASSVGTLSGKVMSFPFEWSKTLGEIVAGLDSVLALVQQRTMYVGLTPPRLSFEAEHATDTWAWGRAQQYLASDRPSRGETICSCRLCTLTDGSWNRVDVQDCTADQGLVITVVSHGLFLNDLYNERCYSYCRLGRCSG